VTVREREVEIGGWEEGGERESYIHGRGREGGREGGRERERKREERERVRDTYLHLLH
jgi:hypothetical protein